ncbi:hypothetical protein ACT4MK_02030 (plasmid) [Bradyrhizobium barranii]|uniref:hypothetical protein n=1 Tax=Bradyrhizobium TaxID=374 RepID=UPI003F2217DD
MASVAYADVLLLSDRLEECGPEAVIFASGARWRDHRSATHRHDDEVEIWQHEALKR